MRRKRLTFDSAWASKDTHNILNKLIRKKMYRFDNDDDLLEWRLITVFNSLRNYDFMKGAWSTRLWSVGGHEYKRFRPKTRRSVKLTDAATLARAADKWIREERSREVREVLSLLEELESSLLIDYFVGERSIRELAADYGLTPRQAKYRIQKAKERFITLWKRNIESPHNS